eukprot:TRINITY_DN10780_c0_g1_i1.p1 TRINITY_DN10780_c0_g1~~TRINITY_DN10780_c0_g1_i1.p1  ORF type:complete len:540 (-),score=15.83 TRINITY_DN10780_c0_g1_i1:106-1704(-)
MEKQAREPLLTDLRQQTGFSIRRQWLDEFLHGAKTCVVHILEDDQEFLASVWSRRAYLGYALSALLFVIAICDILMRLSSLTTTSFELVASSISALISCCAGKASMTSIWVDVYVHAVSALTALLWSYTYSGTFEAAFGAAFGWQLFASFFMVICGARLRYSLGSCLLAFLLCDRSTMGGLLLAVFLPILILLDWGLYSACHRSFMLQRAQEALVQNACDGSCSLDADGGFLLFACPRFQAIFQQQSMVGHSLLDYIGDVDKNVVVDLLQSATQGLLKQCLVTCHVPDAAIVFDVKLLPYTYTSHLNAVGVCLQLQGEVRQCGIDSSSIHASTNVDRNTNSFTDMFGNRYREIQVDSSVQESEDSMYPVMWDLVDLAASEHLVTSASARALVLEAQQMQSFIFSQRTRALQRAAARSLLARYDGVRLEILSRCVSSRGFEETVWHDRMRDEELENYHGGRWHSRRRIIEDVVSAYRVFNHTETFSLNPCSHGLQITCQMLGYFGPLPHHRRIASHPLRTFARPYLLTLDHHG